MEICPKCGLPIQACMCHEIAKEEQKIKDKLYEKDLVLEFEKKVVYEK